MFYSQSLLSRKGPLGNIWLAAYCLKKLRKEQIADTDITSSVDKIMPEVQISYRVLAQLLLGIVRIFSKKVDYLYHDCNEALTNIRKSFIPSQHTLRKKENDGQQQNVMVAKEVTHAPKKNVTSAKKGTLVMQIEAICAPYHDVTITLPEHFELDAFDLEVSDGGDTDKPHEESMLEDERTDERDQGSFHNEYRHREMDAHSEYNSAYFTLVDDVIPSYMMDSDFEISEFFNSSSLEAKGQKAQEDFQHVVESENRESLQASISVGPYMHDEEPEHQVHPVKLQERLPSYIERKIWIDEPKDQVEKSSHNEEFHVLIEGNSDATTLAKTHDKSNFPFDSGLPSPKFAVTTPAKKETLRMLRKRKNPFDETIVLSNEILRMGIHDASTLVCKRKRAPHTFLDAWKAWKITNLQQNFMEPLTPCISLELKAILHKKFSDHSPLKKSAGSLIDSVNVKNEIPNKSSCVDDLLQEKTPANTPAPENHSEVSTANKSYEVRIKESSSIETSVSGLDMTDRELVFHEKDSNDQDDGWSIRTRVVAQYLCNRFLDLKEQKRKEILSLARTLERQTRSKCARLFYEILTLKDHGCIDVKQVSPYDDIIISATSQLEALFKNQ